MVDSSRIILEVCVDSVESAICAISNGADRLEVCGSLPVGGGISPSISLVDTIRLRFPTIPIHTMIRPRIGQFVYSAQEIGLMRREIQHLKPLVDGFVFGALTREGCVDVNAMNVLVREADPLPVTFHRAFDITRNPDDAMETIASIPGITRILTSGLELKAPTAIPTLSHLFERAKAFSSETSRTLIILPGSGINSGTAREMLDVLYPEPYRMREVHSSCGDWVTPAEFGDADRRTTSGLEISAFKFGNGGIGEEKVWRTLSEEVSRLRQLLDEFAAGASSH